MANLRGAKKIIDAVTTTDAGIVSKPVIVGENINVAIMVRNDDGANSATVTFEVAGADLAAGANNVPTDDNDWYELLEDDMSAVRSFAVAAGKNVAVNLSPFAPAFLRIRVKSTVGGSHADDVTAFAQVVG